MFDRIDECFLTCLLTAFYDYLGLCDDWYVRIVYGHSNFESLHDDSFLGFSVKIVQIVRKKMLFTIYEKNLGVIRTLRAALLAWVCDMCEDFTLRT